MIPFDYQKAKDGTPVMTKNGSPARVICFDARKTIVGRACPVIALLDKGDEEKVAFYDHDGRPGNPLNPALVHPAEFTDADLASTTVAYINIIDLRAGAEGLQTGKGAGFISLDDARDDFCARKMVWATDPDQADFVFDLIQDDTVLDSFLTTAAGYECAVGEPPCPPEASAAYDAKQFGASYAIDPLS